MGGGRLVAWQGGGGGGEGGKVGGRRGREEVSATAKLEYV